jgi:hypothetical protein
MVSCAREVALARKNGIELTVNISVLHKTMARPRSIIVQEDLSRSTLNCEKNCNSQQSSGDIGWTTRFRFGFGPVDSYLGASNPCMFRFFDPPDLHNASHNKHHERKRKTKRACPPSRFTPRGRSPLATQEAQDAQHTWR